MTRLLPHPLLTVVLVVIWLCLTRFSLGHLLLGTAIAMIGGWALARIEPEGLRIRSWRAVLRLLAFVSADIVRSNLTVARLIATDGRGARQAAFVEVPLRLRDPAALAVLAIILTATPGTAWLEYSASTGRLLLHVFDSTDGVDWPTQIRDRYESLLLEAFG